MTATALIVELVLTGAIALAALLMPAAIVYRSALNDLGLLEQAALPIALGASFLIGVVIDRCGDTVLDRWLSVARWRFAKTIASQRQALCGTFPVTDVFPEDWQRMRLLTHGTEHVVREYQQLRVRIRIARTVVVLAPAVVTSTLAAFWVSEPYTLRGRPLGPIVAFVMPCFQMAVLAATLSWKNGTSLRTDAPGEPDETTLDWFLLVNPASAWLAVQWLAAIALLWRIGDRFGWTPIGVVAAGMIVTGLAAHAWLRMNKTFMQLVWDYCRFEAPEGLSRACCDARAPGPAKDTARRHGWRRLLAAIAAGRRASDRQAGSQSRSDPRSRPPA